jgi:hypothetical protein
MRGGDHEVHEGKKTTRMSLPGQFDPEFDELILGVFVEAPAGQFEKTG